MAHENPVCFQYKYFYRINGDLNGNIKSSITVRTSQWNYKTCLIN